MKLLIIEDEQNLADTIYSYLSEEGFICESSYDFLKASDKLAAYQYDVVILDITLPGGNGLELLKQIKDTNPETGILIISARDSLTDKLKGLDLGADDYLTKPFHLAELNSRINAIIRRKDFRGNMNIAFNEILIDPKSKLVKVNGSELELTRKEFDLLEYLVINKNRVLTKESIAEHLWGDNIDMADNFNFVYTHIKNLRKKIVTAGGSDYLKTVYGLGYKFSER